MIFDPIGYNMIVDNAQSYNFAILVIILYKASLENKCEKPRDVILVSTVFFS